MTPKNLLIAFVLAAIPYQSSVAAVVISEVLYNEVGGDTTGEWIEIYNNGSMSVDLTNYKIGDEETQGASSNSEGMFIFPENSSIDPGVVQIIAIDAATFFLNYGFNPTYELADFAVYAAWDPDTGSNRINLANTNDQALLLDEMDNIVDAVNWGNTTFLDPGLDADAEGDGQSYERINALVDTDTAADWQLGSPSSPGVVSVTAVPEPASTAALAIASGWVLIRRRKK